MPKVKVTQQFRAVPEGAVYGKQYSEGDIVDGVVADYALRNQFGVEASEADVAPDETAEPPAPTIPPPVRRARISKQCEFEDEGKPARFPKGLLVEGSLAARMVEAGLAVWVEEKPSAEANKSAGAAPENK